MFEKTRLPMNFFHTAEFQGTLSSAFVARGVFPCSLGSVMCGVLTRDPTAHERRLQGKRHELWFDGLLLPA